VYFRNNVSQHFEIIAVKKRVIEKQVGDIGMPELECKILWFDKCTDGNKYCANPGCSESHRYPFRAILHQ